MKKILIIFICILFSKQLLYSQARMNFDYYKTFYLSSLFIDFNRNCNAEYDEVYFYKNKSFDCKLIVDYTDYGFAGNLLSLTFTVHGKVDYRVMQIQLEDIEYYRSDRGDYIKYKNGDLVLSIWKDTDGKYCVMILDPFIINQNFTN